MKKIIHLTILSALLYTGTAKAFSDTELLAIAAYKEARGIRECKVCIMDVIDNRRKKKGFPKTIIGNLTKKGAFPWYRGNHSLQIKKDKTYQEILKLARGFTMGKGKGSTRGATFFRGRKERFGGKLERSIKMTASHGGHNFYTLKK